MYVFMSTEDIQFPILLFDSYQSDVCIIMAREQTFSNECQWQEKPREGKLICNSSTQVMSDFFFVLNIWNCKHTWEFFHSLLCDVNESSFVLLVLWMLLNTVKTWGWKFNDLWFLFSGLSFFFDFLMIIFFKKNC